MAAFVQIARAATITLITLAHSICLSSPEPWWCWDRSRRPVLSVGEWTPEGARKSSRMLNWPPVGVREPACQAKNSRLRCRHPVLCPSPLGDDDDDDDDGMPQVAMHAPAVRRDYFYLVFWNLWPGRTTPPRCYRQDPTLADPDEPLVLPCREGPIVPTQSLSGDFPHHRARNLDNSRSTFPLQSKHQVHANPQPFAARCRRTCMPESAIVRITAKG